MMVQIHSKLKMTKKTNSLIFRFGLSVLWKNKSLNTITFSNIIQLENILYKELKKKNFKILYIKYDNNLVNIFVYNFLIENNNLKFKIIKYFFKQLDIKRTVENFGISKIYIKWILKNIKIKKSKKIIKNKNNQNISILWLFFSKYILYSLVKKIKNYNFLFFNKLFWILNCLFYLENKFRFIKNKKKIVKKYRLNLRKINGLIKFKIFGIFLENIIFKFCKFFFKVKINNILLKKNFFINININKKYKKYNFIYTFNTIILSVIYKKAKLISDYLSILIKKDKNHKKVLTNFVLILEKLFFLGIFKLKGLKLRLSGKLNGNMRKSKYQYKLGKVQLQTLKVILSFNMSISYTKFGAISIKTWILNGNY